MTPLSHDFIRFALDTGALRFGEFRTKAGRLSPYFFNAGLFHDGAGLGRLAGFYAERLLEVEGGLAAEGSSQTGAQADNTTARAGDTAAQAGNAATGTGGTKAQAALAPVRGFDVLFGPAYKGITLASAMAVACAQKGRNIPFAFNRKEAKDHGEGGNLVGAPLKGRVAIIDDVISAGTSVRESVEIIRAAGAEPAGVFIALDRMERGGNAEQVAALSAVDEVRQRYEMEVHALATLDDLLAYLTQHVEHSSTRNASGEATSAGGYSDAMLATYRSAIADYRRRYGTGGRA